MQSGWRHIKRGLAGSGHAATPPEKVFFGPLATVGWALAVFFLAQLIGGLILALVLSIAGWGPTQIQAWITGNTLGQFVTFLLIDSLMVWAIWRLLRHRKLNLSSIGLKKPRWGRDVVLALASFGCYFLLLILAITVMQRLLPSIDYDQKQQLGFESVSGGSQLLLVFISLAVLPPIAEEIMVRGFLFTGLRKAGKWLTATLITSALFATAHLQIGSGESLLWPAAVDTFVLSVVLCYIREKSGSLVPGMIVHAIKNSLAFFVLFH